MTSLHSSPSTPLRREFLPPMGALLAFESAARNASISRAAEELHLTQSAVSRQILNLEEHLGTALFQRVRQRVILTDAGREFAVELRSGLAYVAQATQRVMTLGGVKDVLNIAVLPMFATRWLIPRMDRFAVRLPAVLVNYASRTEPFDFRKESFDVAIHYGEPFWPDGDCTFVLSESVLPVCSPKFKALNKVRSKADIGKHTLLQQTTRPTQWSEWFDEARMSTAGAMRGPRYEQFSMLVQAAVSGHGIALVPRFMVEEELRLGLLVVLCMDALVTRQAYYVVLPHSRGRNGLAEAFRDWLVDEANVGLDGRAGV